MGHKQCENHGERFCLHFFRNVTGYGKWNVQNVENFASMFLGTHGVSEDFSLWNTASATTMVYMFGLTPSAGTGLEHWNVSSVESFSGMFLGNRRFNASLAEWETGTAVSMAQMFEATRTFAGHGLENWDVRSVNNFSGMFKEATGLQNNKLSAWNVTGAENLHEMFYYSSFSGDLCKWGNSLSQTANTTHMFFAADCEVTLDPFIIPDRRYFCAYCDATR